MASEIPGPQLPTQPTLPRLHLATTRKETFKVRTFLSEGDSVNLVHPATGKTALHYALESGHEGITNLLLSSNADIHAADNNHQTPLHIAANASANFPAAQILLEKGADVNAINNIMLTPLQLAMRCLGPSSEAMVKLLLDHGADVNTHDHHGRTPLHKAAVAGHIGIAKLLLKHGASVTTTDHAKLTPLHSAVKCMDRKDSAAMTELLLQNGAGKVVNAEDEDGSSALHWAALGESRVVINRLLESGANINAMDKRGRTPLDRAVKNMEGIAQAPEQVRSLLMQKGALHGRGSGQEVEAETKRGRLVGPKGIQCGRGGSEVNQVATNCLLDLKSLKSVAFTAAEDSLRSLLLK